MSVSSTAFLQYREQLAAETDEQSMNELLDFINVSEMPPVPTFSYIPYIEKHGYLLDQRNLYADLMKYSLTLTTVSRTSKGFWIIALERQYNQLRFIEDKLLEVESSMS